MLEKGLVQENLPPEIYFLARCRKGKFNLSVVFKHLNAEEEIGVGLLES